MSLSRFSAALACHTALAIACVSGSAHAQPATEPAEKPSQAGAPSDTRAPADEDAGPPKAEGGAAVAASKGDNDNDSDSDSDSDGDGDSDDDSDNDSDGDDDSDSDGTTKDDEEAATAREQREEDAPRPPPLTQMAVAAPPEWDPHIELGGEAVLAIRPLASGPVERDFEYQFALGWGLHLTWEVLPWLRVRPYFVDAHHDVEVPQGALVTNAANSIGPEAQLSDATAETFMFGARVEPTLNVSDLIRVWLSVGVGWGRAEIGELAVIEAGAGEYTIRKRSGVMVEFPLGLGVAFEVWPSWLVIEYQFSAAPVIGQSGTLYEAVQAVDGNGELRDVGPLNPVEVSVVQTLGLALIL